MSTHEYPHKNLGGEWSERRSGPRLEVLERIHSELRALDAPVTLLNLSYGGFLIQVPVDFTIGGTHDFRFTVALDDPIVLRARVVHTMRATIGGVGTCVVGLEFEDQQTVEFKQAIESLVCFLQG